ncbi:EcoRI family type II restriction endonuclease [Leuconostoc miyukkimchii]|uniref:EcoRI family type II restriction endonuclease n=1 Tax=Leuconostoc miyukkimchii TaxID=910540 RepID=UPI001FE3C959|nr:EcoRI family type II restriction endonuclease [Leuconostoc miyukkimchii]
MVKNQSTRLTDQHKISKGVVGIFGANAKKHDLSVGDMAQVVLQTLEDEYPSLQFRYRTKLLKSEINQKLNNIDTYLGQSLFVRNASIIPDGGLIEVMDDSDRWRVVLVSEAKYQGKDIENIENGQLVGSKNNQDLMAAGNAIERSHKNISEIANFMIDEVHFPYVIFLEGSNFLTQTIKVTRPDGRVVTLQYDSGMLNRLDRLTAANYGMPFNVNLCKNKIIHVDSQSIMLQAASMYTTGDGSDWDPIDMGTIMLEVAKTALQLLGKDLFKQITTNS